MPDLSLLSVLERANLPRNMIENSMFEEEPDVVDLAKDSSSSFPVRSLVLLSVGTKACFKFKKAHLQGLKIPSSPRSQRVTCEHIRAVYTRSS